ncbi:MAG TPA: MmgE/PrpD family protein [Xanthobacteraceae bacterium]|nr:MmgE/PrpD family protein [Xanthobacteraceae bacterium]
MAADQDIKTLDNSVDRRAFLGTAAASVVGLPNVAVAQQHPPAGGSPAAQSEPVSEMIADFIVGFDLKNAPPLAIERSRTAFVDAIGVMLAGSQLPPAEIVGEVVRVTASAPAATIVGRPLRAAPQLAALANGVAGHDMDFDLTYFAGQTIAGVIPAILPVAEASGATSADMLSAFIIAAEVAGRVTRAAPLALRAGGWHSTGTIGVIAAAAACARLMKVEAKRIPDILGITTSLASGVSVNFGTMTKPLHAGHAAHDGVLAAMLGARGFTANDKALEGKNGYYASFARGLPVSLELFASLGKSYDLVDHGYSIKPYPCGGLGHTAIDAALELRHSVNIGDVAHVDVAITKWAAGHITDRYPKTIEAAKFSAPYLAAYSLVHGAPLLAAFTEQALQDDAIRAAAQKVSVTTYQEYADLLDDSPAKVTITLNDGRKIERAKYYPSGSVKSPMTAAQIKAKFDVCAAQVIDKAAAEKLYAMLSTLGSQPSLDRLWPLLRRA